MPCRPQRKANFLSGKKNYLGLYLVGPPARMLCFPPNNHREDAGMTQVHNKIFDFKGINHLALVCKDMARTVDFYSNTLGMPLIKTIDLPNGMGQHFFFDIGNGDSLAFFWFPNAPEATPGVAAAGHLPGTGKSIASGHGSMNHVAFNVPEEKIDEYHERLLARGVECTKVVNHDDSLRQISEDISPSTFVRSIYFFDPDGICLEIAAWTRVLDPKVEVRHEPVDAEGKKHHVALEPAE
jgi:catechol 2,3-dioxygenase-like lactoylglutathione lyase family enzyme